MTTREKREALEYEMLSPLAAKSRQSRRRTPIKPCPFRTDFQRDRDRILHSKAFRRLKRKTQVYIVSGDHYRTRMTHSLEVSQIARTIARGLSLNEDLTEAIALGHDVGHTAFGHAGEAAMAEIIGHFAHNEQSLRVVEYLERDGEGLNLTFEVKDGILNHTGKQRPKTLEGRIVRIADRIAYLCHDYDDSLRAGMLHAGDLPAIVYKELGHTTSEMITGMVSDLIINSEKQKDIILSPVMTKVMAAFRDFMFQHIYHSTRLARERKQAVFLMRELFAYYMEHFDELPAEFRRYEARWGRRQTVVDYVAGLSDNYAVHMFARIFMPPVGFFMPGDA